MLGTTVGTVGSWENMYRLGSVRSRGREYVQIRQWDPISNYRTGKTMCPDQS